MRPRGLFVAQALLCRDGRMAAIQPAEPPPMKAHELAALLQKLQQEFRESAKSLRNLLESAAEPARERCREELMRLDAKLDDPAIRFKGMLGGSELRRGFEWARGTLKVEIAALAKASGTIQEALAEARAAVFTVAEELEDAADYLRTAPIEHLQGD